MKLSSINFDSPFELSPDRVQVLVVEQPGMLYGLAKEFFRQTCGEPGSFVLSDNSEMLNIPRNLLFIYDYLLLDNNERKHISYLYKQLQQITEENFADEFNDIRQKTAELFCKLNGTGDFEIDYNEDAGLSEILKAYGVSFRQNEDKLPENLLDYIGVSAMVQPVRCVVLLNVKSFLTKSELLMFYREMQLEEISLFLIENCEREALPMENIRIIDKDLCEIVVQNKKV